MDVAFREGEKVGMGVVLRDNTGDVLMSMCNSWYGSCDVEVGEAMATRQGMKVAMEAVFYNFVLETDNMPLFEALRSKKKLCLSFRLI
ncbi:hypothetical protein BVRB_7g169010 [Beta vulgaris subsp. vulgaris]|nr:hypothetical protein BVRB_7g169010 [Beta vulgaris subsp. vulgaris]